MRSRQGPPSVALDFNPGRASERPPDGGVGDVLEGPAVADAEGSQGFGQSFESAHGKELTPLLAVWQQGACDFPKKTS